MYIIILRKLELLREYTFPDVVTSDRIWMRNRRLPYSRHCSASYRESQCRISFNVINPVQLSFNGHKFARAFAAPISLGENSSFLSEEKNISDSNEILPDDASEDSPKKLSSDEVIIQTTLAFVKLYCSTDLYF